MSKHTTIEQMAAFAAASLVAMVAVSELIRLMCWAVLAIGCPLHGMDVPPLFW